MRLLVLSIVVMLAGCASTPASDHSNVTIEKAVRKEIEKPTGELTTWGLEGIAKDGLVVVIEPEPTRHLYAIENQVKRRLGQSGIEVVYVHNETDRTRGVLIIKAKLISSRPLSLDQNVNMYLLTIEAKRGVTIEANGKTHRPSLATWSTYSYIRIYSRRPRGIDWGGLSGHLNKYMDKFLIAYLKANPKKKEK